MSYVARYVCSESDGAAAGRVQEAVASTLPAAPARVPIILCKSGFPKYRASPRATSLSRLLITRRVTNTNLRAEPFSPPTKYTRRMLLYALVPPPFAGNIKYALWAA